MYIYRLTLVQTLRFWIWVSVLMLLKGLVVPLDQQGRA